MEKVLLHACCAPCAAYCIEKLLELNYKPVLYFYNPNIFPPEEFKKRYNELKEYCVKKEIELIIQKQDARLWYDYIEGLENEPEAGLRCNRCFELRLTYTASRAIKFNIEKFTTTLTISPHKKSENILKIGREIGKKYELEFLDIDFKKENGYLKSTQIAKEENFYRQTYCGCEFSV